MLSLSATSFMLKRQENNISLIVISILKQNFESVCKTLQKVESYWSTIQNGAHWLRLRFGASISYGWLKAHCHAIWQLYEKLGGVFASTEFQN